MMQTVQFMVFLFVLTVGKTPQDQREFARIAGTWHIVGADSRGSKTPAKIWRGKTFVIRASTETVKQTPDSMLYTGALNTQHKPPVIETHQVTYLSPSQSAESGTSPQSLLPANLAVDFYILYEVHGDRMKLLLSQVTNKKAPRPTVIRTTAGNRDVVFHLQRK
jgi:uncharacterized protein (TIGR03067 family)